MVDYFLPTTKDVVSQLILTGILWAVGYFGRRFWRVLLRFTIPKWLTYMLALYTVSSLLLVAATYIYSKRPLELHQNEIYDHKTILLDGKLFKNCVFTNTKFIIQGKRTFKLINNNVDLKTCEILMENRASIGFTYIAQMKEDSFFKPAAEKFLKDFLEDPHPGVPNDGLETSIDDL